VRQAMAERLGHLGRRSEPRGFVRSLFATAVSADVAKPQQIRPDRGVGGRFAVAGKALSAKRFAPTNAMGTESQA
jgi:hypothetical protein